MKRSRFGKICRVRTEHQRSCIKRFLLRKREEVMKERKWWKRGRGKEWKYENRPTGSRCGWLRKAAGQAAVSVIPDLFLDRRQNFFGNFSGNFSTRYHVLKELEHAWLEKKTNFLYFNKLKAFKHCDSVSSWLIQADQPTHMRSTSINQNYLKLIVQQKCLQLKSALFFFLFWFFF